MTKTQPRPEQLNEYRGLGATIEKEGVTKKWLIDKLSEKSRKPIQCCSNDIQENRAPVF